MDVCTRAIRFTTFFSFPCIDAFVATVLSLTGSSTISTAANTASGSPPAIVARLAKERSLDEGYFGDNTSNLNLSPTALDFINSLPDLAYLLH